MYILLFNWHQQRQARSRETTTPTNTTNTTNKVTTRKQRPPSPPKKKGLTKACPADRWQSEGPGAVAQWMSVLVGVRHVTELQELQGLFRGFCAEVLQPGTWGQTTGGVEGLKKRFECDERKEAFAIGMSSSSSLLPLALI